MVHKEVGPDGIVTITMPGVEAYREHFKSQEDFDRAVKTSQEHLPPKSSGTVLIPEDKIVPAFAALINSGRSWCFA